MECFRAWEKDEVELAVENLAVLAVDGVVGGTTVAEHADDQGAVGRVGGDCVVERVAAV